MLVLPGSRIHALSEKESENSASVMKIVKFSEVVIVEMPTFTGGVCI